jgi:hypothetical protein
MPAGDGTGPVGIGPMTGRAAGFCGGYPVPGYMNLTGWRSRYWGFGRSRGRGCGRGFGRGWGRGIGRWGYGAIPYYGAYGYGRYGFYPAWW